MFIYNKKQFIFLNNFGGFLSVHVQSRGNFSLSLSLILIYVYSLLIGERLASKVKGFSSSVELGCLL